MPADEHNVPLLDAVVAVEFVSNFGNIVGHIGRIICVIALYGECIEYMTCIRLSFIGLIKSLSN